MPTLSLEDRAIGALMGAFIGDALALGPHWYYDLDQLHADYGQWISDYTTPKPGRYHAGMKAGQLSQSGVLLRLTLQSLVDCARYDEADFCRRMDTEFFPLLDGTPMNGPGGYTSQSIREAWRKRVSAGLPWGQVAGNADTTEAAERILAISIRYALQPAELASAITRNTTVERLPVSGPPRSSTWGLGTDTWATMYLIGGGSSGASEKTRTPSTGGRISTSARPPARLRGLPRWPSGARCASCQRDGLLHQDGRVHAHVALFVREPARHHHRERGARRVCPAQRPLG